MQNVCWILLSFGPLNLRTNQYSLNGGRLPLQQPQATRDALNQQKEGWREVFSVFNVKRGSSFSAGIMSGVWELFV